jgi:hypothetical protein
LDLTNGDVKELGLLHFLTTEDAEAWLLRDIKVRGVRACKRLDLVFYDTMLRPALETGEFWTIFNTWTKFFRKRDELHFGSGTVRGYVLTVRPIFKRKPCSKASSTPTTRTRSRSSTESRKDPSTTS